MQIIKISTFSNLKHRVKFVIFFIELHINQDISNLHDIKPVIYTHNGQESPFVKTGLEWHM